MVHGQPGFCFIIEFRDKATCLIVCPSVTINGDYAITRLLQRIYFLWHSCPQMALN